MVNMSFSSLQSIYITQKGKIKCAMCGGGVYKQRKNRPAYVRYVGKNASEREERRQKTKRKTVSE
jgi:hypothetical protein